MTKHSNRMTWFLATIVVMLTVALVLQSAYLVWLHRQLYLAVAGTGSSLGEIDKLLNSDVGLPSSPSVDTPSSSTAIQKQAERALANVLQDPALRDLFGDLGLDAPEVRPQPNRFQPEFNFQDKADRYVVTMDLPGVKAGDVQAVVREGELVVSGTYAGKPFSERLAFPGPVVNGSETVAFKDEKLTVTARKAITPNSDKPRHMLGT